MNQQKESFDLRAKEECTSEPSLDNFFHTSKTSFFKMRCEYCYREFTQEDRYKPVSTEGYTFHSACVLQVRDIDQAVKDILEEYENVKRWKNDHSSFEWKPAFYHEKPHD